VIDRILKALAAKGEVKAGDLKLSPAADKRAAIERLRGEGLIEVRREGRTELLSLTAAGRERAPRAPETVEARLERIEAALARIEAHLAPRSAAAAPAPVPAPDLKAVLLELIAEIDGARRYGGLVPIPEVRQALRGRGVAAGDADVNGALVELEREYAIDLSVAQSPTAVADRAAGIERPGRGLAYYVVRRQG
jgi:DNA-binding MarR family transcriptional regulator